MQTNKKIVNCPYIIYCGIVILPQNSILIDMGIIQTFRARGSVGIFNSL